ncbi:response regulator [Stygiobacter electus]|uniref:Response regulator n=1 Tax=Stygiobacter electus TaxID=3032292 RepID=A0AAE3TBE2_9BACT|nr:response regulator [Stygiobacter electus]MDF1611203.1 response regulator [Stygiobacter electus]
MDDKKKVLIVDDEELAQDFLRFFLSKKYDVYSVGSVNSFYNIINTVRFDLILMDVSLKDSKDGIQLTKELKSSSIYKNVPIFVLTAFNTTAEKRNAEAAGADKFLSKPVDQKLLMRYIDEALNNNL